MLLLFLNKRETEKAHNDCIKKSYLPAAALFFNFLLFASSRFSLFKFFENSKFDWVAFIVLIQVDKLFFFCSKVNSGLLFFFQSLFITLEM